MDKLPTVPATMWYEHSGSLYYTVGDTKYMDIIDTYPDGYLTTYTKAGISYQVCFVPKSQVGKKPTHK